MKKIFTYLNPTYWGLSEREKEIRDLEKRPASFDRDMKLTRLKIDDPLQRDLRIIELEHEYNRIDDYQFEEKTILRNLKDFPDDVINTKLLQLKLKFNKIDQYGYDLELLNLTEKDEEKKQLGILEINYKHSKIDKKAFEKEKATLLKQPYIEIVSFEVNSDHPSEGAFSLDWNSYFIEELHKKGYVSPSEESTVQMWFNEVCKNVALEAFDGVGDFSERVGADKNLLDKIPKGSR